LLLIEINSKETQSIIPGKLFEYGFWRPIIAIGPNDSDFADIISETGSIFNYSEKENLKPNIELL
jgi:hypothetical protein